MIRLHDMTTGMPKPELEIVGGQLHVLVERAQELLLASGNAEIFQRAGSLVRIVRLDEATTRRRKKTEKIERSPGALVIEEVTPEYLAVKLTEAISWQRYDGRAKKKIDVDAPPKVAVSILKMSGSWKFPTLVAVIEAPTLRPDGTILDQPGYDEQTGLYFEPGVQVFEPIPEHPTREDAMEAIDLIADVLDGFPFIDADKDDLLPRDTASFSVTVAAIITATVRRSIRSAPLFCFSAPMMGSGKSLLAYIVGTISTGRPAAATTYADDEAEDRKRLMASLIDGDSVISIDNIDKPFGSTALCSILTEETYRDRILGVSRNVTVPTCATFLATGNNISVMGDLSTRVLIARIDPRCERPDERQFDIDLKVTVPRLRAALVRAALTIARAYIAAGRPPVFIGEPAQPLKPFGRFEEWSTMVRAPLVWLGLTDPCASRSSIEDEDPERIKLGSLLRAWGDVFGSSPVELSYVAKVAKDEKRAKALAAALDPWRSRGGELNTRRLGRFISAKARRVHGGRMFERAGKGDTSQWRVTGVSGVSGVYSSHPIENVTASAISHAIVRTNTGNTGNTGKDAQQAEKTASFQERADTHTGNTGAEPRYSDLGDIFQDGSDINTGNPETTDLETLRSDDSDGPGGPGSDLDEVTI